MKTLKKEKKTFQSLLILPFTLPSQNNHYPEFEMYPSCQCLYNFTTSLCVQWQPRVFLCGFQFTETVFYWTYCSIVNLVFEFYADTLKACAFIMTVVYCPIVGLYHNFFNLLMGIERGSEFLIWQPKLQKKKMWCMCAAITAVITKMSVFMPEDRTVLSHQDMYWTTGRKNFPRT